MTPTPPEAERTPTKPHSDECCNRKRQLTNNEKTAIELTRERNPTGVDFQSGGELNGELKAPLVFVEFKAADGSNSDACVFFPNDGPPVTLEANQLAQRIRAIFPSTFWRVIASPASFSGFIALIITFTISVILLFSTTQTVPKVPVALSGPLAVIVGFYFSRFAFASTSALPDTARKAVEARDPTARNVRVEHVIADFLDGDLVIANYEKNGVPDWETYVHVTSEDIAVYEEKREIGELAQGYRRKTFWQMLTSVTTFGGAIAVLICATLCALAAKYPNVDDPVPVLSTSLTTILAFYFGTQSSKR